MKQQHVTKGAHSWSHPPFTSKGAETEKKIRLSNEVKRVVGDMQTGKGLKVA